MKFLKKLKSSNFWVSMISAVVLILQAVFNVEIKTEYLNQIIMAILGLLVMSGIVTDTNSEEVTVSQKLDMDAIKQNIADVVSSVTAGFEKSVSSIVASIQTVASTGANVHAETKNVEQVEPVLSQNEDVQTADNDQAESSSIVNINKDMVQPTAQEENLDVL